MRRRHALKPDTFPFLAVLLCAMGSLILLLLVMDRRAKFVARHKAQQVLAEKQAEGRKLAQEEEARAAELEQRRRALQAERARQAAERERQAAERERWRQLVHGQLAEQIAEVRAQGDAVNGQLATAIDRVGSVQSQQRALLDRLQAERACLNREETEIASRQGELARQDKLSEAQRTEMARLAQDLELMERTMAELHAARQRQQQTWSVVPYRGKHGDNRKPLYIECASSGIVLHPDRKAFDDRTTNLVEFRAEVERRLAGLRAGSGDKRNPYVLLLIRPDGIRNYYETVAALEGLTVDFGYEFIDAGWLLDFPGDAEDPAVQPWMTAAVPVPARPTATARLSSAGGDGRAIPYGGPGASGATAPTGRSGSPGIDPDFSAPPSSFAQRGSGLPAGLLREARPGSQSNGGQGASPSLGYPVLDHAPSGSTDASQAGSPRPSGSPSNDSDLSSPPGSRGQRPLTGQVPVRGQPSGTVAPPAPVPGGSARSTPTAHPAMPPSEAVQRSSSPPPDAKQGEPSTNSGNATLNRLLPADPRDKPPEPPPPRPRRLYGNREWTIAIECTAEGVHLQPTRQRIPTAALAGSKGLDNPLVQAVHQLVVKRQATVRPGEPLYRPRIQFLVWADGLQAYHRAYPLLEPLRLPMARENLPRDGDTP